MENARALGIGDIVQRAWPDADPAKVMGKKISHRRNADHWRIQRGVDTLVIRSTKREDSARRILAALQALDGKPFAPRLGVSLRRDDGTFVIAMEDLGDAAPSAADTQSMLPQFVAIVKRLHNDAAFGEAVSACGRNEGEDSSLDWAEEEWAVLKEIAPDDVRLAPAIEWMAIAREYVTRAAEARSIMVSGHGDLHNANWRQGPRGLALIDWEEIRRWPLARELADFIVFGHVDPAEVTRLYGASPSYAECIRREAATCALSFYLYWLRTMVDASDPRAASFEHVRSACEQLFRTA